MKSKKQLPTREPAPQNLKQFIELMSKAETYMPPRPPVDFVAMMKEAVAYSDAMDNATRRFAEDHPGLLDGAAKESASNSPQPGAWKRARLCTREQAKQMLQVGKTTIHKLQQQGKLTAIKLTGLPNSHVHYDLDEVQKLVEEFKCSRRA